MPTYGSEIIAAHAALAAPVELIEQRRLVYSLAHELVSACPRGDIADPDVLDSPVARAELGVRMSGAASSSDIDLIPLSALSDPIWRVCVGGASIPVASTSTARSAVDPALSRVAAADGVGARPALLTALNPGRLRRSVDLIRAGAAAAHAAAPELVRDLLPHVALLAVVDDAGRLGSASVREFPGLVVVPEPASALEAAEALVHEAAHQKIFDLVITRDLLPARSASCPPFVPPWHPAGSTWSLEQTLAAWHAYRCLSVLASGLGAAVHDAGASSLLPVAGARADVLGEWLHTHRRWLGCDARRLLRMLSGAAADEAEEAADPVRPLEGSSVLRRWHGDRLLVGIRGPRPELFWVG